MSGQANEQSPPVRVFRIEDYDRSPKEAINYAVATGEAVVVNSEGRPVVILSIPTHDLPPLLVGGDDDE